MFHGHGGTAEGAASSYYDWLETNYNVRTSHVFAMGHSYGAFFSYYISVCLSNRVAAFGEHSGGMQQYDVIPSVWVIWWPIDVPVGEPSLQGILLHSTGDGVVAYSNSVLLDAQMGSHGHTRDFVTLPAEMGHGWDKMKNQQQWDFFFQHAPVIDDDSDGMPDWWERLYFTNGIDAVATDDADGDGGNNWYECMAGTVPTNPASRFEASVAVSNGTGYLVRWPSASNRIYTLYWATNLMESPDLVESNIVAMPPLNTYTDNTAPLIYYEVQATIQ